MKDRAFLPNALHTHFQLELHTSELCTIVTVQSPCLKKNQAEAKSNAETAATQNKMYVAYLS